MYSGKGCRHAVCIWAISILMNTWWSLETAFPCLYIDEHFVNDSWIQWG